MNLQISDQAEQDLFCLLGHCFLAGQWQSDHSKLLKSNGLEIQSFPREPLSPGTNESYSPPRQSVLP